MQSTLHQDLRRTAEQLRVSELQTLLRALGVKKLYGKKSELIERFNELLRTSDVNQLSMCERLIRDAQKVGTASTSRTIVMPPTATVSQTETGCFTNWTVSGQSSRYTATTSAHTSHNVNPKARVDLHGHGHGHGHANSTSTNGTPLTNGLQMYRNLSQPNVASNVKFKPLAFYDILAVVRPPQVLEVLTMAAGRNQDTQVSVTLTNEHISAIQREARYHRTVNITEHAVQVQLRFCRIDASGSEQDDNFPSNISVRMNERTVTLPPIIPTNKVGVEPKRPGRPLDVTPHCRLLPTGSSNTLHIGWAIDAALYNAGNPFTSAAMYQPTHAFALYLVRRVTVDELIARLHKSAVLPISDTRRLLSEKLRIANIDDSESEAELAVASRSLTVNLACPLSKTRMHLAVRSRNCPHAQCFDASTYLNMNEKKPTWTCPVCDRPAPFFHLIIDALVQAVLESPASSSCRAVALRDDGAWRDANDDGGACVLSSDDDGDDDDDYAQRDIKPTLKEKPAKGETQPNSETWYTVPHDIHLTISRRHGGSSGTPSSSSTTPSTAAPPATVSVKPNLVPAPSVQSKPPSSSSAAPTDARPPRPAANSSVIDLTESDNEAEQPASRAPAPTIVRIPAAIANQYISVSHPANTVKRVVGPASNPTYLSGHSVINPTLYNTHSGMAHTATVTRPPALQPIPQSRAQIPATAAIAAATAAAAAAAAAAQANANANRRNAQRSYTRKKRRRSETETETDTSCSTDSEEAWNSSSTEEELQKNGRKSKRKARARRVDESDGDEPGLSCTSADAVDSDEPTRRITRGMRRRGGVPDDFDEEALEPPTMVGRTGPSTSGTATLRRTRVTLADEDSSTEENEHEPAVVDSLRNRARSDENDTEKLLDPTVSNDLLGTPLSELEAFATSNSAQMTERQDTILRQSLMDGAALHDCFTSRSKPIPPALSPFLAAPSNNSVPTRSLAQSQPVIDWQNSVPPSLTPLSQSAIGMPAAVTDERELARFEAIINSIRSSAEISSSDKSRTNVFPGSDIDPFNLFAQSLSVPNTLNHASSQSRTTLPSTATALSLLTNRNLLSVLTNGSNAAFATGRSMATDNLFAAAPIVVNTRQFDGAAPLDLSPVRSHSHSHSPHSQLSTNGSRPSSCSPLTTMLNNPPLSFTYEPNVAHAQAQAQARYSVNTRVQSVHSTNEAIMCARKGSALNDTNTNSWLTSQSPVTSSVTTRWPSAANSGSSLAPFSNSALFSALSSNAQFAGGAGHQSTMLRMSVSRSSSNDTALAGAGANGGHSNVSSPINYELN